MTGHQADQRLPADALLLPGLEGSNPVGFLASLGTLQTLTAARPEDTITMSWDNTSGAWNPVIHGIPEGTSSIGLIIANHLKCPFQPDADADAKRDAAQKKFDETKTKLKKAQESLKKKGLRGKERDTAEAETVAPVRQELYQRRSEWLVALRECVPSLDVSLGKHLNATGDEFREGARCALDDASCAAREVVDLYASFGSDACLQEKKLQMVSTPFCFITGSGHQYFLDSVRQLFSEVDASRLDAALLQQSEPRDEKLSMRWDPREDRRYALMWDDPTASDNKAKTNWAINLLAYRGLQLLPSVPGSRGLMTTGWPRERGLAWTWPIWRGAASSRLVRSVLSHPLLVADVVDAPVLAAIGIAGVYRAFRIQVGNPPLHKINFAPARKIA